MIESKKIKRTPQTGPLLDGLKQAEMFCMYSLMDEPFESPRAESVWHAGDYLCMPTRGDFKMILKGEGITHEEMITRGESGSIYSWEDWRERREKFDRIPYTVRTEPIKRGVSGDVLECFTVWPQKHTKMKLVQGSWGNTGCVMNSDTLNLIVKEIPDYKGKIGMRNLYLMLVSMPAHPNNYPSIQPRDRQIVDFDYFRFLQVDYSVRASGKRYLFMNDTRRDWYYMLITGVFPSMSIDGTSETMNYPWVLDASDDALRMHCPTDIGTMETEIFSVN